MKKIVLAKEWICIDEDRIQINAISRYQLQVASMELKLYMTSGEIFKIALETEAAKNQILNALDEMTGLRNN